jgi:diaminohydroxyphosphoribosylaminopyrimidine deaminase/5-amino-6-(5-phosphoribosylamino)uracil reductase
MNNEYYMQRCIELAEKGRGYAAPNPLVGCVIVHDSKIIGEGYHAMFGSYHAEVNAINSVKDKSVLTKSILYVTLEPCSHFGKTPPCTDLIIQHGIPEVIIGCKDPFEKVSGKGIKKLKAAGIKVYTGVLEKECRFMNRRFLVFHEQKRPYIILKWASSKDGFIAPKNKKKKGKIHWISNEYARILSHKWRSEEAAIMVGTTTAEKDNPELTVRNWTGKNPVRIVIDKNLRLNSSLHLFDKKVRTIVFTSNNKRSTENLEFVKINFESGVLTHILNHLYMKNIQSLIVEGGTILLQSFIENKLWDEARVFMSDGLLYEGIKAPLINVPAFSGEIIGDNSMMVYYRNKKTEA